MTKRISLALSLMVAAQSSWAAVNVEEAKQLGTTLTRFGAVQAANAAGTIPAYDPGAARITPPADYKPGSGVRPNPFPEDRPTLVITARNMDQYADQLSEGTKTMLKRWPTFAVKVYPTRRTAWYPEWVLERTLANATSAQMVGESDGVSGAQGGVPFPIPKTAAEVLWNHNLSWTPEAYFRHSPGYLVDTSGSRIELTTQDNYYESPYYKPNQQASFSGPYMKLFVQTRSPAQSNGRRTLIHYSTNYAEQEQKTWIYTPGQRRVRLAPDFKYDTAVSTFGGAIFYDEVLLYSGRPDKFNWKLVGQKEMFVPANNYDYYAAKPEQVLGPQHLNPDLVRWELQRVWQIEGTRKAGERHVYDKRVFYYDGDTWKLVLTDNWDYSGTLARTGQNICVQAYDAVEPQFASCASQVYDLRKGAYSNDNVSSKIMVTAVRPPQTTQPATLAGQGVR
ncbi:hypothetical protein Pres01_05070 [Metapseudomonas resinovorans]|uniref:DUF1329 domain-containing protein n=1 Tax=Pseudomonadaceae TaxID=135621 RepID=UPI00131E3D74|nr:MULTISPECIES: DUF1329 domain-containing protein [Pseudomonas]GLZ84456.1 hypothetical protein Pres01_05070 [Pseudomonas resinovorans]